MFIQNNTEILFLNNYADNVGGVIFVHNVPAFDFLFYVLINCSVMLLSNDDYRGLTTNITLIFTNNTGRDGGDCNIWYEPSHMFSKISVTRSHSGWRKSGP